MDKFIFIAFNIGVFSLWAVCGWALFTKANIAGWKAFVPFYSMVQYVKLSGKSPWHAVGFLIPGVGLYSYYVVNDGVSKNFGHGKSTTWGIVLMPFFFLPWLAFGQSEYCVAGPSSVSKVTPPPFTKPLKKPLSRAA